MSTSAFGRGPRRRRTVVIGVLAVVGFTMFAVGCGGSAQTNADGAFEGTAERVREDSLRLRVGDDTIRVDTWAVCGDNTRRHISDGDELVVYASRELRDHDAWRILNADGDPACEDTGSVARTETDGSSATTDGGVTGTVERVREDELTLQRGDDGTMVVDTWSVCGDHTARHISVGDEVTVFADRDRRDYDAWRILDADGDPACPGATPQ